MYLVCLPITKAISISQSNFFDALGRTILSFGPTIQFAALLKIIGSFGISAFVSAA